jgi:hypothetical protein
MYRQINCNSISPRDTVYLGNISVNTLHKKGNVNNNKNNDNNSARFIILPFLSISFL